MKNLSVKDAYNILLKVPEFKNQYAEKCLVSDDFYAFPMKPNNIKKGQVPLTGTLIPAVERSTGKYGFVNVINYTYDKVVNM